MTYTHSKRRLERIENAFGHDLVCTLEAGDQRFECDVVDFNALGFRLNCRDNQQFAALTASEIRSAKIVDGTYLLGSLTYPEVLRSVGGDKRLVLVPSSRSHVDVVERPRRASVPYLLEPTITGSDPIRLREQVVLRVDNISETGFRAKCSLSNRHFMAGQKHSDFTIFVPTAGTFKCSFVVVHVTAEKSHLSVGCQFVDSERALTDALRNFMLLCLFTDKSLNLQMGEERMPKKLSPILRIRRVGPLEMEQVLDLRLRAYRAANKVADGATAADMADVFDQHSIVLGAYVGARIAGTVRVVFSQDGSQFPFEKFFRLPNGSFQRARSVELSRMAVDPALHGSDMVFRMMQAAALEFVPKADRAFLMSTEELANNYLLLGADRVAGPVPHPVNAGENLSLFVFTVAKLKTGKMSALAWLFFAREIIDFMSRFGFTVKTPPPLLKYMRLPFELMFKKSRKIIRRWRRAASSPILK